MKLLYKRAFIIFSVALNVGFVIVAGTIMFHHASSSHDRLAKIENIVYGLDLPEAQETKALASIRQFRTALDEQDRELDLIRDSILHLLASSGPIDKKRLHQLHEAADQGEIDKHKLFEAHVVELRTLLGDEKGAQFFSLLLDHLKNKNHSNNK